MGVGARIRQFEFFFISSTLDMYFYSLEAKCPCLIYGDCPGLSKLANIDMCIIKRVTFYISSDHCYNITPLSVDLGYCICWLIG